RIIAQIVVLGTQIVGKAFIEAYKQAAATARAAASSTSSSSKSDAITQKTGLTLSEASQILNANNISSSSKEEILKKYEHLFNANDPGKGGSFYLQSKVYRALERLEMEWAEEESKKIEMGKAEAKDGNANSNNQSESAKR
ncbi:Pam16-domain-containing protein, partial [Paraphysoderma sedebokerense]